jgi:rubrerythrin
MRREAKMSKTDACLKEAFAGESQANRKYLAFAEKADSEGHQQVARLFRAAAEAETVHAINHLMALDGVGSTEENLKEAISGETHEFKNMYPEMLKTAKEENNQEAERSFRYALKVEEMHAELYRKLLDTLGGQPEEYPYYVCPVCGNTTEKAPPPTCPICGASGSKFKRVD